MRIRYPLATVREGGGGSTEAVLNASSGEFADEAMRRYHSVAPREIIQRLSQS